MTPTYDLVQIEAADCELLSRIGTTMAEAIQKSGHWIVCRPGCTECCMGPFEITGLDAVRLRKGLAALQQVNPARAAQVEERARNYVATIGKSNSGDFPSFLDDVACPALDPETGCCDLYEHRPITCRTFGPAVRIAGDALGACELCYKGAADDEIAQCAVELDTDAQEAALLEALGGAGNTLVAYALFADTNEMITTR